MRQEYFGENRDSYLCMLQKCFSAFVICVGPKDGMTSLVHLLGSFPPFIYLFVVVYFLLTLKIHKKNILLFYYGCNFNNQIWHLLFLTITIKKKKKSQLLDWNLLVFG